MSMPPQPPPGYPGPHPQGPHQGPPPQGPPPQGPPPTQQFHPMQYGPPPAAPTPHRQPMSKAIAAVWTLGLISVAATVIGLTVKENGHSAWDSVHAWGGLAIAGAVLTIT